MNIATQNQRTSNISEFISRERSEKFDLLGQLILNQRESLVLCGEKGIGKTTFLHALEDRDDIWTICFLDALDEMSFERVKTQLIKNLVEYDLEFKGQELSTILDLYLSRQKKIVLAIDDAYKLKAGVINQLIEYALSNPAIRIVFALTKKQLCTKHHTDESLDDCYLIEIPPLKKSQMKDFLYYLSKVPDGVIVEEDINDNIEYKLYQQSLGIPGLAIADLPDLVEEEYNGSKKLHKIVVFLALIIFALLAKQLWRFEDKKPISIENDLLTNQSLPKEMAQKDKDISLVVKKIEKPLQLNTNELETQKEKKEQVVDFENKQQTKNIDSVKTKVFIKNKEHDNSWVLEQSAKRYTLQLMVLSKKDSLEAIFKRYPSLIDSLKFIHISTAQNRQKYVLLYGSFTTAKAASHAISSLPAEFKHAWVRRFYSIHREMKRR